MNSPMSGVVRTERRVCGLCVAHGLSGTCLIAVSPRCPPTPRARGTHPQTPKVQGLSYRGATGETRTLSEGHCTPSELGQRIAEGY